MTKSLSVDLLKPWRSSMTKVLYMDNGIEVMEEIRTRTAV